MKTILIIDDNLDVREIFTSILEAEGYQVLTAENGEIGIEMALRLAPDLLLCDIEMPNLNGYEVLKQLQADEKFGSPFFFIGASPNIAYIQHEFNLGHEVLLPKTMPIESLIERIHACLD